MMRTLSVKRALRGVLGLSIGVGVAQIACTPTKISEEVFAAKDRTCYEWPSLTDAGTDSFRGAEVRAAGCGGDEGTGGTGSASHTPPSGMSASPPLAMGSAGTTGSVSQTTPDVPATADGGVSDLPRAAGDAGMIMGAGGMGGTVVEDDCTEQRLRAQFAKEYTMGGCQDSTFHGCHGGTAEDPQLPNLLAADLVKELVGGSNPTRENQGKCGADYPKWITPGAGLEQSLLWSKASSTDEPGHGPFCGDPMPPRDGFAMQMPPDELACLGKWIQRVAMASN